MSDSNQEKKGLSLPVKMLIGMLLGVGAGMLLGDKVTYISFVGEIFIRLLKMCIYPLVLISIIGGVANVVDVARLKKVGVTFLLYSGINAFLLSAITVVFMTWSGAGEGVKLSGEGSGTPPANIMAMLVSWIPNNVFTSLAEGNLVQIIIFAVFFGLMLVAIRDTKQGAILMDVVKGLDVIMGKMVGAVIKIAPYGVFALMANMVGTTSTDVVVGFSKMLLTYYAVLLVFLVLIAPTILSVIAKVNPIRFYKNVFPAMVMAASTCSSVGTIPVTMHSVKNRCGVPSDIVEMLTAPAATINMTGAAAEYTCFVLFAAHAFNVPLSIEQIALTILLCVIMSAGAAGVPGGGIMMCAICLNTMGLPDKEMVAIVAGIYVLIDFASTMVNVTSDTIGMVTVSGFIGDLDRETFNAHKVD